MRFDWWDAVVAWLLAEGQALVVLGILVGATSAKLRQLVGWIASQVRKSRAEGNARR